ncbi:DUF3885 domain-containing protein [Peribacillus sp. SI8-4]|uniref:DUF3885 domain-containing protein n=1 Tax=Peribacillus sp. SI8-4 TaxID=3048009 RepID=UPI0025556B2C|nr:DUF3885 domain-containing protein [Peribacillus sp. SI8-4]
MKNFPNLELKPPLFYNGKVGIRFELGLDYDSDDAHENSPYIQGVYKRAITLFKSLHTQDDDIFIVADVDDFADGYKHEPKVFSRYMKDKSVLYQLNLTTIPYMFPEDNDEKSYQTHRFTLQCKTSDFRYISMIKAICNQDMGIKPSIFNRIYFINISRKTIFYIYDDRGCDLLATTPESVRAVYQQYNDWILDYDRIAIDAKFK